MCEISLAAVVALIVVAAAILTSVRRSFDIKEKILRKETEREIEEAKTAMLHEKAIRQEFFTNVSHELKTPITSIRGYTELLVQGFVTKEKEREEFYKKILAETRNMCELIEDSLEISRLESKEVNVKKTQIRISVLLAEIVEELKDMAEQYQVTLHKECEPLSYFGDVNQMTVLLKNLIGNGIKYNRPGGEVWIHILRQNGKLMLIVKDNGIGIAKEDRLRIFERFYRVDKGRCKKTGGTGLGLSIVKHIVEYNEGSIEVESSEGKGSRFVVWLPFLKEKTESN